MFNNVKTMKNAQNKLKNENKKRRNIILQSYNDIKDEIEKENKENISINSSNPYIKFVFNSPMKSLIYDKKMIFSCGRTPIVSKNNKVILITEDKYDKALKKGKSPFFISDKINLRKEFKPSKNINYVKPKHLGLCDYYSKNKKKNKSRILIDNDEEGHTFSKTPRFHRDVK